MCQAQAMWTFLPPCLVHLLTQPVRPGSATRANPTVAGAPPRTQEANVPPRRADKARRRLP